MFYHLLFPLRDYLSGLNLFRYISFRAGAAAVTALLLSFVIGPWLIRRLKRGGVVEEIRKDGPETHFKKAGTPTMGGWIILPSLLIGTLLFARLDHPHVWIVILATIWMGLVGFWDDWLKYRGDKKGLIPRYKLLGQITLGLLIGVVLYFFPEYFSSQFAENVTQSTLPFFKNKFLPFAPWGLWPFYILMVVLVITATSNSVNLTDGLDGLAIGIVGIIAVGMAILAYVTGHIVFSGYLNIVYLPGSGELAVYCAALVGAALGFLWFNATPAQVIMGDTGALALGAGLATVSIIIMKELFLIMLGGILVAESLSVLIQRYYFKYTRIKFGQGRRVFKMAPLHH
ncbi:MAG: phospho-N-acetylmuramoyl-pentapeptide-transferase, partial [Calditrichota bacterium]